jgi:hypothetical protein
MTIFENWNGCESAFDGTDFGGIELDTDFHGFHGFFLLNARRFF